MGVSISNNNASANGGRRVLVVDDERSVADTLRLILQMAGYEAHATYSGEEAVNVSRSIQPHLVLSDVMMPGIDGIDAAVKILDAQPDTKIVLFSGNPEANAARAKKLGLKLLAKPIAPDELLNHIQSELEN